MIKLVEYDLRKDIDRFKHFLDVLEVNLQKQGINDLNLMDMFDKFYDQSEVDVTNLQFSAHLTTLNNDLTGLSTALNEFNDALFHLDEANVDLETDLSELADNLSILTGMLDDFSSDLTDFQSDLNDFDFQLNGDATHDGFVDTLTSIQTAIGDENTPSSLKGMLHDFGIALQGVASGDNALSLSLTTLSGYLTAFEGTLQEFKTQISNDLGSSVYDGLDEQVINLIYSIANTKQDVDAHKDELDDLSDMIGTDQDSLSDGTLYGVLNNTSSVASSASTTANTVSNTITNTISPQISSLDTASTNIKNKMGYNNIPNGSTLQGQITSQGNTIGTSSDSASANTLFGKVKNAQETADSVDTKVGEPTSTSTNTVFGSINNVVSSVGNVENAIDDVETKMYKGSNGTGTMQSPANGTVKKLIDTAQSDISDVQTNIGDVDVDANNDLQSQILTLIGLVQEMMPTVAEVDSLDDVAGGTTSRGNRKVNYGNYAYNLIHTNDTNKYYRREHLDTSGTLGYYGEWVEISSPYISQFISTKLFQAVDYYFRQKDSKVSADDVLDLTSGFVDPLIDDCTQSLINDRIYSAIQGKQDIPVMELIETQTGHGVTGKVYSDGLMVYITLDGNPTSINGTTTLVTFTETDYMPNVSMIIPVPRSGSGTVIRLTPSGSALFYPSNLNNSPIVEGAFTFPLKSRLPSEE